MAADITRDRVAGSHVLGRSLKYETLDGHGRRSIDKRSVQRRSPPVSAGPACQAETHKGIEEKSRLWFGCLVPMPRSAARHLVIEIDRLFNGAAVRERRNR